MALQVWVRDVHEAVELLDEATGTRTPKEQVFLLHYRRFGVVTDLVKSTGGPLHMFSARCGQQTYSLPHACAMSGSLMSGGPGQMLPTAMSASVSTAASQ